MPREVGHLFQRITGRAIGGPAIERSRDRDTGILRGKGPRPIDHHFLCSGSRVAGRIVDRVSHRVGSRSVAGRGIQNCCRVVGDVCGYIPIRVVRRGGRIRRVRAAHLQRHQAVGQGDHRSQSVIGPRRIGVGRELRPVVDPVGIGVVRLGTRQPVGRGVGRVVGKHRPAKRVGQGVMIKGGRVKTGGTDHEGKVGTTQNSDSRGHRIGISPIGGPGIAEELGPERSHRAEVIVNGIKKFLSGHPRHGVGGGGSIAPSRSQEIACHHHRGIVLFQRAGHASQRGSPVHLGRVVVSVPVCVGEERISARVCGIHKGSRVGFHGVIQTVVVIVRIRGV